MLTKETINQIRLLRNNGCTIARIHTDLNICTRTILKYLKTTQKEPEPVILVDGIEALKAIVKDHEKDIQTLKTMIYEQEKKIQALEKPDTERSHKEENIKSIIKVSCNINEKKPDPDTEMKYYSSPQVAKMLGIPSKTIRDMCRKFECKKDEKNHYKISEDEKQRFKDNWKPRVKRKTKSDEAKNHPLKTTESG